MDSLSFPQGYGWSYGFWTKREQSESTTSTTCAPVAFRAPMPWWKAAASASAPSS